MPKDDINYKFTENGIVYDFYDVFVPAENFRQPSLFVWGYNEFGQLGTNDGISRSTPVTTFAGGTTWKSVACGRLHTAAIKTDGTLWTWGAGGEGPLGNNASTNRSTPVTTFAGGTNWKQVACGYIHTAAVKTDGTLWVWGRNNDIPRLGDNTTTSRNIPVTTFAGGTNWKSVSTGKVSTVAIKTDGTLWVWGGNDKGQLGTNDTTNRNTPVTTFAGGTNWKQVSCINDHILAIKTDGSLWTWGNGADGRLGTNDTNTRTTPVTTFAGGNNWKSVAFGGAKGNNSAAIKTDGSLWTWGDGGYGRLGTNNATSRSTPVTTFAGGNNWKSATIGDSHTGAIKTDGSLWVWGATFGGQLGNNISAFGSRNTPVTTFAGGTNWKQVACGDQSSGAIKYSPDP
jgi:alpha-tubulin suppressor-like RCC1 family protein